MRLLERMRKECCMMAIVRAKLEPSFSVNRSNCLLCPFSTLRTNLGSWKAMGTFLDTCQPDVYLGPFIDFLIC
jgi:hypothetical protein